MTTAIVTGFTVHEALMRRSFSPLLSLYRSGVINRIIYVTWDSHEVDACVAPIREWPEVELVRIPQPVARGGTHRAGFIYQSHCIAAALNLVPDGDELVLKTRPDFLFDEVFLANKIAGFVHWGKAPDFSHRISIKMPPSPFKSRIWVPWANASAPFYFEDATFMGLASDLSLLANPLAEELMLHCGDYESVNLAHVMRHVMPFFMAYPIFQRYIRDFHLFRIAPEYRLKLSPLMAGDPFFWHMVVANAWILNNSYHVDCGRLGDLRLVPSAKARAYVGLPVDKIPDDTVYHVVETLRGYEEPGTFLPLLLRPGGRLLDDDWQMRLFAGPVEQGFTHENLLVILENLNRFSSGILKPLEDAFYDSLENLYRECGLVGLPDGSDEANNPVRQ